MVNLQLCSSEVLSYINQMEFPYRGVKNQNDYVSEVIRYGSFVGSSLEYHSRLERAMVHARHYIDITEQNGKAVKSGRIILAGSLSGSKGRFTREWHAPEGGLWGCLIHANTLMPPSSMLLSLAVGLAACETIQQMTKTDAKLRWVNDVLIDGLKVAGFLIESHSSAVHKEQFHLIGFGINVNNQNFPDYLAGNASSLRNILGKSLDLREFALSFIAKLSWNIGLLYYMEAQHFEWLEDPQNKEHPVLERFKALSDTLGKKVVYGHNVVDNPQYRGVVKKIGGDGGLYIQLLDGSSLVEHSGEIRYL